MNTWIFTFGVDSVLKDYVVQIHGEYEQARETMFSIFGDKWYRQYSLDEYKGSYNRLFVISHFENETMVTGLDDGIKECWGEKKFLIENGVIR